MNDDTREILRSFQRTNFRLIAKLKALEASVLEMIPPSKRNAWHKKLKERTNRELQVLFDDAERKSPRQAALLDDRKGDELDGL